MPSLNSLLKGTLLLAVASLPLTAAAPGKLGFSLGVKRNSDGECKETADYEADFDILKKYTDTIRTYATSDCNTLENIMPAVVKKGMKIVLGVWYVLHCFAIVFPQPRTHIYPPFPLFFFCILGLGGFED